MGIKLYGNVISTATNRVRAALAEKELDYEFIPIDLANQEHKKPEFLSLNPFGQVPAFEDADLKLIESAVGDCFTLADLHHLPSLKYLMGTQVKKLFDVRPHVSAWAAEIQSRPAWIKVITSK